MTPTTRAALRLARLGWAVLPLAPGSKRPLSRFAPRGVHSASKDPREIQAWFERELRANVGVACGETSGGLVVIDADGPDAVRRIERMDLPTTVEVRTRRGRHWYFQAKQPVPSTSNRLGPHIDVQSDARYVVAPPSVVEGRRYRWQRCAWTRGGAAELNEANPLQPGTVSLPVLPTAEEIEQREAGGTGRETVPGCGGWDLSRSGLDARMAIRLVQREASEAEIRRVFRARSAKYQERRSRRGDDAADEYMRSVVSWAVRFTEQGLRTVRVSRATLEVLGGTPPLARIILRLVAVRGVWAVEFRLGVPNGEERTDAMWRAAQVGIEPQELLRPEGHKLVWALEGRLLEIAVRGGRIVWLRAARGGSK